jgi:hypothetical protein
MPGFASESDRGCDAEASYLELHWTPSGCIEPTRTHVLLYYRDTPKSQALQLTSFTAAPGEHMVSCGIFSWILM